MTNPAVHVHKTFRGFLSSYRRTVTAFHDELGERLSERHAARFRFVLGCLSLRLMIEAQDINGLAQIRDWASDALRGGNQLN